MVETMHLRLELLWTLTFSCHRCPLPMITFRLDAWFCAFVLKLFMTRPAAFSGLGDSLILDLRSWALLPLPSAP